MTLIFAHRGRTSSSPENSITGIISAARAGADGVEIDVRVTADATAVLMHDPTGLRTTGHPAPIDRSSAAEVTHWQLSDEPVPTLEHALTVAAALKLHVIVDLKDPAAADAVARTTHDTRHAIDPTRLLVWTADPDAIDLLTHAPTTLAIGFASQHSTHPTAQAVGYAAKLGLPHIVIDHTELSTAILDTCARQGLAVSSYFPNSSTTAHPTLWRQLRAAVIDTPANYPRAHRHR
ncbi:glycerophosphodiester phosphodiesterase [Nocardia sp. NPDC004711]